MKDSNYDYELMWVQYEDTKREFGRKEWRDGVLRGLGILSFPLFSLAFWNPGAVCLPETAGAAN